MKVMEKLIPTLPILGAAVALTLSLLGYPKDYDPEVANNIVIALLGLLAMHALWERLSILGRIETSLQDLNPDKMFHSRDNLPSISEFCKDAQDILFVTVVGNEVLTANFEFFGNKLLSGCEMRVAISSPDSQYFLLFQQQYGVADPKRDILGSIDVLRDIKQADSAKRLEVRFQSTLMPFSAIVMDSGKRSGALIISFHSYHKRFCSWPFLILRASDQNIWYDYFLDQMEEAWKDALETELPVTSREAAREKTRSEEELTEPVDAPSPLSESKEPLLMSQLFRSFRSWISALLKLVRVLRRSSLG